MNGRASASAFAFPAMLLCVAIASVRTWFRDADLIYFWDATIPLAPGAAFVAFARIVRDDFWPARLDLPALATIPYAGLLFLLSGFGRDVFTGERILFAALYAAPFLTAYVAFGAFLRERLDDAFSRRAAAAAAALCYGCNAYVLFNLWRIFDLNVFVYAIFPLVVMFARDYLRGGRARDLAALATIFLAGIPGYTNPATVAGLLAGFGTWLAAWCVVDRSRGRFSRAVAIGLVTGLALAPFVVPQLVGLGALVARLGAQGTWPALGANTVHSTFWSVLRLVGDGVTYERYPNGDADYSWAAAYHADAALIVSTSIVPLLALVGAIVARRAADAIAAAVAAATLAALALGPKAPLIGGAFFACFRTVTFCSAFRNPFDKFALTLPFFEATLVALAFAAGARFGRERGARPIALAIATFAIVALPMYAGWPLFTGAVERETSSRPASRVRFPADFAATTAIVARAAPVLVLPWTHVPLVAERWRSGYVGYEPLQFATYVPVASTDSDYLDTNEIVRRLESALVAGPSRNAIAAARALGFRTIAVRLDDDPTFTPSAGTARAIARNLTRLGLRRRTTSTVAFYDLGNVPRALAATTLIVAPPDVANYRTGRELVAGDVNAAAVTRAAIGIVERRPLDLAFDRASRVVGAARIDGRLVRVLALSPLASRRVAPRTFALDSGDGSADYPGLPSFPRTVANAARGTLATAWHQRYVETSVTVVPRAKAIALRLPLRNRSAGVAALSVDFTDGSATLGHERFDVAPAFDGEARVVAAIPRGSRLAIVRLVAIPDRVPVSLAFGVLEIAQYARDPRAVVTVRRAPSRAPAVVPVATVRSAYRTTYRLPAGAPLAVASLAASSHVDWVADTGGAIGRPPDGVAAGFAPMWFLAASKHARTITLVDRSGEIGRLVFGGLASLDALMLVRLWFACFSPSRRTPRGRARGAT